MSEYRTGPIFIFTNESIFHLLSSDGCYRVHRSIGERYQDDYCAQRQRFGGGSFVVWGGITASGQTSVQIINGNLIGVHYLDESIKRHVVPFIQRQQNHITLPQDNTSPHVARAVRACFCAKECCFALASCFPRSIGDGVRL
jgi:hypothetical protein